MISAVPHRLRTQDTVAPILTLLEKGQGRPQMLASGNFSSLIVALGLPSWHDA